MMIFSRQSARTRRTLAMSVTELMVASAIGSIVLAAVGVLWMFGARSFAALGNYRDLDARSRFAVDRMSRDIRQSSRVLGYQNAGSTRWLTLTNANQGEVIRYVWTAEDRTLVCEKTRSEPQVYLTECDQWTFEVYQRSPQKNQTNVFFPAINDNGRFDPAICKLVDMSWKCSRTILGQKVNTESVQTAQFVLRNKP